MKSSEFSWNYFITHSNFYFPSKNRKVSKKFSEDDNCIEKQTFVPFQEFTSLNLQQDIRTSCNKTIKSKSIHL